MSVVPAQSLIQNYAAQQKRLCEALFDQHPFNDITTLVEVPKRGSLAVGDQLWEFQRHGSGICFTRVPTNEIVDVHTALVTYPGGVDGWRFLLHPESMGIDAVKHGSVKFDATDQKSLHEMLRQLSHEGFIVAVDPGRDLYVLPAEKAQFKS